MSNLPFVNIPQWVPNQVANWLRGLDDVLLPYVHFFLNDCVTGKQLLFLNHGNLRVLGVDKLGHRELILEAVEMLHSLYYDLELQTVQSLALQLSCKSCSLRNEIIARLPLVLEGNMQCVEISHSKVPLSVLTGVSDVISTAKQIVSWLDRSPFDTSDEYIVKRDTLIAYGMELLDGTQKEHPLSCEKDIMDKCRTLTQFADKLIQDSKDPLVIQPVSLEITTIRKKPEDDLGMHIQSLYNGTHIIGGIKDQSPADLCGKVEEGDEVIQVNYQTVVGWHLKKLVAALKDNKKEVTLTLKKRPHHVTPFGPHINRRKVPKNVKQSTFPKAFRRKSREEKSGRPPLKDFLNSMPVPYTKDSSQEPDSDNENEVFQMTVTTPCLLPLPIEQAKQRRATVSGGSPPAGKRNSLEIIDLTVSGRPKSYTISSPSSEVGSVIGSPTSELMSPRIIDEHTNRDNSPTKENKPLEDSICTTPHRPRPSMTSPEVLTTPPDDAPLSTTQATALTTTLTITPPSTTQTSEMMALPPGGLKHSTSDTNMQLTIPSLEALSRRRKSSDQVLAPVAGVEEKGSPQLLKITRINSQRRAEIYDQEKKKNSPSPLTVSSDDSFEPRPDSFGQSYTVNIVGGVAQKVATHKDVKDSPSQSPSGLLRRKHFMKHIVGANRRISCKDLGGGDCQGWLWKKKEGIIHGKWVKRWFILKQKNLYYYKSQEDDKAQGVIHLPGFKVSPAPETKSKKYAFKAYHTGTTFHFASERQVDMGKWMNKMGLAAIVYDTTHITTTAGFNKPPDGHSVLDDSHAYYSESDEENDSVSHASGRSTPTSPPSPKRGISPIPGSISSSREDLNDTMPEKDVLVAHFAHIRRANVTLDGYNSHDKRASNLSKAGELDITNIHEVELHRKLHSLCRTLKVKERELDIIDHVIHTRPMTSSTLETFKHQHPDIVESLAEDYAPDLSSDGSISESDDL